MKIKTVFHIDENEKWMLLIVNVKNLCKGIVTEQADIEILANSVAVEMYKKKDSPYREDFEELNSIGVRMCACNNSLIKMNLKREELFEYIEVVPIGVKDLIEKQLAGYAYIKP